MSLEDLWTRLAEIQVSKGIQCGRSGKCGAECCRPSVIGGEPGVTEPEAEVINRFLAKQRGFRFYEAGRDFCKFLGKNGRCRIYAVRPIDCRIHFCKDDTLASQTHRQMSNQVADYHSRHEAVYLETELLDAFRFAGES